jgi:arylsulfatase A-like enzyme
MLGFHCKTGDAMPSGGAEENKASGVSRREALKSLGAMVASAALPQQAVADTIGGALPETQPGAGGAPLTRPNILWITGEGIPQQALSCYGGRLMETPNIDRIAKEGMRFEQSFVTNALCAPSRATLLTGTYSNVNGMVGNPDVPTLPGKDVPHFDEAQQTVPKILKQNGYQTGMVGKWHLPANPGKTGFDYFVYKEGAGGPYYDPNGYLGNSRLGSDVIERQHHEGYQTDVLTDLAIKGIRQFKQPFLMMLQYFNAHRPFDPPHRYEHLYDKVRVPEPGTFWDDYKERAAPAREARMRIENMPDFHPPAGLTGRQRKQWNYQQFMAHYFETLRAQDENIGRLVEFLDRSGLARETVVVYTADHGFFLGDHGWFDKRFMYEQALKVPWMIRYPGLVKAGSTPKEWVVNIDNAPTILDIAGVRIPAEMQGRSLLPILRGESPADWRTSMYYHYYEFGPPHWVAPHYGIRTEKYKLISYYSWNEWELFDLDKDPDEMESLFAWAGYRARAGYESIAEDLAAKLKQLREEYKDTTGAPVNLWPMSSYD